MSIKYVDISSIVTNEKYDAVCHCQEVMPQRTSLHRKSHRHCFSIWNQTEQACLMILQNQFCILNAMFRHDILAKSCFVGTTLGIIADNFQFPGYMPSNDTMTCTNGVLGSKRTYKS